MKNRLVGNKCELSHLFLTGMAYYTERFMMICFLEKNTLYILSKRCHKVPCFS